jgi:hypothetical protein
MGVSDIITLVALIIAIVAILNEKNRSHLLLKFHVIDYALFFIAFVLINYFVFYESFYERGWYLQKLYFTNWGFRNPKNWAYGITVVTLIYILYKIWYSFYSYSKLDKVIGYYQKLIENGEISFLLDLIERYHRNDIIQLIEETPDYEPDASVIGHQFIRKTFRHKIQLFLVQSIQFLISRSKYNRSAYAYSVLYGTINSPHFMALSANLRPYLFAALFSHFKEKKRDGFPDDLINHFLNELIANKNFWLKKELKESAKNDPTQPEWFYEENKILAALIQDLSVADVNEIWRPFGDGAIKEIEEERTKGYESRLFHEYTEDAIFWDYTTYWSIQFFYLIINESIVKTYTQSHFWLFYYDRITSAILKTMEKYPSVNPEDQTTIYHKFIENIIDKTMSWLDQSNKKNHPGMYHNVLDCLGSIILDICRSRYYGESRTISALDSLLRNYCDLEDNENVEELRDKYEEIFLRPSMLAEDNDPYYTYMAKAWENFDKIPHMGMHGPVDDLPYFTRLKEKVIKPLGFIINED